MIEKDMMEAPLLAKPAQEFKVSPYRWVILFIFALPLAASSYVMLTFAAFATTCAKAYEVDVEVVNSCVIVYLACSICLNLFSSPVLEKFGLAYTFRGCAAIIILGSWIRYFSISFADNFYYLLVGQTLPAIAQPFLINGVSKVATQWFGDDERGVATAIGSLADQFGNIMGFVLAPFFITEYDGENL